MFQRVKADQDQRVAANVIECFPKRRRKAGVTDKKPEQSKGDGKVVL